MYVIKRCQNKKCPPSGISSTSSLRSHAGHKPNRGHCAGTAKLRMLFVQISLAFYSHFVLSAPRANVPQPPCEMPFRHFFLYRLVGVSLRSGWDIGMD